MKPEKTTSGLRQLAVARVTRLLLAASLTGATQRVSVDSAGNQGNSYSNCEDISPDGRFVVLLSGASNLVAGDTNGFQDIFVHDRLPLPPRSPLVLVAGLPRKIGDGSEWRISIEGFQVDFIRKEGFDNAGQETIFDLCGDSGYGIARSRGETSVADRTFLGHYR